MASPPLYGHAVILATLVLFAGCLSAQNATDDATESPVRNNPTQPIAPVTLKFDGRLSGTPVAPGEMIHEFDVGALVVDVKATLKWSAATADLQVVLSDIKGKAQGSGFKENDTTRSVATVEPPEPGKWKAAVRTTRAVDEPYELTITLASALPTDNLLRDTSAIAVGEFLEANLVMEGAATFNYTWKVVGPSTTNVYFNIHSHKDGVTTNHVEKTATEGEGSFTAPERQIYSLFWQNQGVQNVQVEYEVRGAFRVHSVGG